MDHVVLITGGAGFIGTGLIGKLITDPLIDSIRVLDNNEHSMYRLRECYGDNSKLRYLLGDIRDKDRVKMALDGVDTVIHAAAYKHVFFSEYNCPEFIDTNVIGTLNLIMESLQSDSVATFINISTDKAVVPTNLYGVTKLLTERMTLWAHNINQKNQIFISVRFGNVLGSHGSVVPKFLEQIRCGELVTITDSSMRRFIMTLDQATDFVIECTDRANGGEIFIKKMEVVNIMDLATALGMVDYIIIGSYKGEKIHECLMSYEESIIAREYDDYYVIDYKNPQDNDGRSYLTKYQELLSIDEIRELLKDVI